MSRRVSRSIRETDPVNGGSLSPLHAGEAEHASTQTHASVTATLTRAGYAPSERTGAMMEPVT